MYSSWQDLPHNYGDMPFRGQTGPQPGIPGFPSFPGGQPGGGPPIGAPPTGAPTGPPPSFIPQQQLQTYAIDAGAIRGCLYRFTYVWLEGYQSFWFFPTYVGRRSIAGYRWTGYRWVYFGIDLDRIDSFQCV
ncbi:hypothetical protein [Sediminibacillus albus]|uniref:Transporter n=1 Tax=Sediminibacillus albus TaxID=407036 RepID=A0A1G8X1H2_9BACI|nr:hypothetical protein [Sediminibacillus albus]SDJ84462.1 hypothetical protein SAMN05216243_1109 [Sediminibacillus albus]